MNGGDILFDALNGVSDRYVLEAGDLLRIGEGKPHGRGQAKLWNTARLAAALVLLLAARGSGAYVLADFFDSANREVRHLSERGRIVFDTVLSFHDKTPFVLKIPPRV